MNEDFADLLDALLEAGARFVVVGAYALAVHGVPRATGDLDILVDATPENAARVWAALRRFGAPVESLGIRAEDFSTPGIVVQIGVPPRRIDLLTRCSGVHFDDAWASRAQHRVGALEVPFIGRDALIKNKRATGRTKDLADVEALERLAR